MSTANTDFVPFGMLYPSLLLVVPDTATPWLDYVIAQAASDVAMRTRAVRTLIEQDAQANVSAYPVELPENYTLAFVERVCVNGRALNPLRTQPCSSPDICATSVSNNRGYYWDEATRQVVVYPAPGADQDRGVQVELSLIPNRDACGIPRILYDRYAQAIIDAATLKIAMSPNAKTNPRVLYLLDRQALRSERRAVSVSADASMAGATPIDPGVARMVV